MLNGDAAPALSADPAAAPAPAQGFVLTATGQQYRRMASAAAAGLRAASPGLPVWLFSDEPSEDPVFDRVVLLDHPWRRSKIDAMLASPFARTVYLDADVFVVADISDLFDLLDRFDIALAHDQEANSAYGARIWRRPFPACFPQFNSGVIAFRSDDRVRRVLRAWRDAVREGDLPRDQPALRELLWESDLRIATLPREYNYMDRGSLFAMKGLSCAPRIIHHPEIHRAGRLDTVDALLGRSGSAALGHMIAADRALAAAGGRPVARLPGWRKRLIQAGMLIHRLLLRPRRLPEADG